MVRPWTQLDAAALTITPIPNLFEASLSNFTVYIHKYNPRRRGLPGDWSVSERLLAETVEKEQRVGCTLS